MWLKNETEKKRVHKKRETEKEAVHKKEREREGG